MAVQKDRFFTSDAGVPVQSLNRVPIDPDARRIAGHTGVGSQQHLSLLEKQVVGVHRVGVRPDLHSIESFTISVIVSIIVNSSSGSVVGFGSTEGV